jgi:hypothetical protein
MQPQSRSGRAHPPRSPASGVHTAPTAPIKTAKKKTPPPILASEVLREDLAPLEPGRRASQWWDGAVALLFLAVGVLHRFGFGVADVSPQAGAICLAAAAATGATGLVPFPYLWRAVVGGLAGAIVVALGLFGAGPLALLGEPISNPLTETFRVVTCVAIPAALLFRSHYRAYDRGRLLLGIAFVLALPFLASSVHVVLDGPTMAKVGAGLAITGALLGLIAFMSAPTTLIGAWCAQVLTALIAADIGLRQLYAPRPSGSGTLTYVLTGVAFFAAVVPIALGLFQTWAAVYAREARLVDVHRPSAPEPPPPSMSD